MQINRLRELREQHNLTAVDLENIVGIKASSISLQENMKRGITIENAIRYCEFFKVSLDYFFCREDNASVFDKYKTKQLREFMDLIETEIERRENN